MMSGIAYARGQGRFATSITTPSGGTFSQDSPTQFQFFTVPLTLAVDYRFNLFRFVRPYVLVGPSLIGYYEKRSDDLPGHRGITRGLQMIAGVALSLDWLSSNDRWSMFANYGIQHTYLTLDYSRFFHISGDVNYSVYGLVAGLAFEL